MGKKGRGIIEDCFIPERPEAGKAARSQHVREHDGNATSQELLVQEAEGGATSSHWQKVPREEENSLARSRQVNIQVTLLATTLAYPYLLNHLLLLQKTLLQIPLSESL